MSAGINYGETPEERFQSMPGTEFAGDEAGDRQEAIEAVADDPDCTCFRMDIETQCPVHDDSRQEAAKADDIDFPDSRLTPPLDVTTSQYAFSRTVLAVAKTRVEGAWNAYIGAVVGDDHDFEQAAVLQLGAKIPEKLARAMFPQFPYSDLPYAH